MSALHTSTTYTTEPGWKEISSHQRKKVMAKGSTSAVGSVNPLATWSFQKSKWKLKHHSWKINIWKWQAQWRQFAQAKTMMHGRIYCSWQIRWSMQSISLCICIPIKSQSGSLTAPPPTKLLQKMLWMSTIWEPGQVENKVTFKIIIPLSNAPLKPHPDTQG